MKRVGLIPKGENRVVEKPKKEEKPAKEPVKK